MTRIAVRRVFQKNIRETTSSVEGDFRLKYPLDLEEARAKKRENTVNGLTFSIFRRLRYTKCARSVRRGIYFQ